MNSPVLFLLLRDLQQWACITFLVALVMAVLAVPVTFMANNSDEFRSLPWRLIRNWFSGVVHTVGSWIVLTWLAEFTMQLLFRRSAVPLDLVGPPLVLLYLMCLVVSVRIMWRNANKPAPVQRRTFSLSQLLWTQAILLLICGCWVAVRREELQEHYQLQAEHARRAAS